MTGARYFTAFVAVGSAVQPLSPTHRSEPAAKAHAERAARALSRLGLPQREFNVGYWAHATRQFPEHGTSVYV